MYGNNKKIGYNIDMKRIIMFLITYLFIGTLSCFADVVPRYTYSILNTGIGTFNAPNSFTVYEKPDELSKKLLEIKWDDSGLLTDNLAEKEVFSVFVPSKNIAYCIVEDEIDGWVKIYYSQSKSLSGWVKTDNKHRFVSWFGFYMSWGRRNGVYVFNDMPVINKRIMSAASANSQKIAGFTWPKYIKLTLVRGNWMLVKMLDFGDEAKVGWMQWRDENGKFLMFPIMTR